MMKIKSLAKNSIYNVIYKFLNALFPLASAAYVSRMISASGVGKVASAQNIVQYFVLIAALGIPNYGTREIAKERDSDKRNTLFSELFLINGVSTVICIILFYFLVSKISYFSIERKLYYITGINILLNMINVDWFYQGIEQYQYITIRSFCVKIFSLLALFLFVKNESNYITYALINVLAVAGNYVFNLVHLKKTQIKIRLKDLHIEYHFKPVLLLFITTIFMELYTLLDTTMISIFCSSENVAYYTNSMKIVKMIITIITAMGGVLLPRLSFYVSQGLKEKCNFIVNSIFSILFFLFLPAGIGLMFIAKEIVIVLFGSTFVPAIMTMRIAACLIYTLGFSNLFGTQVLLTFNAEAKLLFCTVIGAIINILMNSLLIPVYQQNGAAIAFVISEAIVSVLTFMFSRKYILYKLDKRFLAVSFASTVCVIFYLSIVKLFVKDVLFSIVMSVVGAIIVYFLTNIIGANPIINKFKEILSALQKS